LRLEVAARERCNVGAVRSLIGPGGNLVMPIWSREIVIGIVALEDVCDWLIDQDLCSHPKPSLRFRAREECEL